MIILFTSGRETEAGSDHTEEPRTEVMSLLFQCQIYTYTNKYSLSSEFVGEAHSQAFSATNVNFPKSLDWLESVVLYPMVSLGYSWSPCSAVRECTPS